jgi:cysteine-rich repeat protein
MDLWRRRSIRLAEPASSDDTRPSMQRPTRFTSARLSLLLLTIVSGCASGGSTGGDSGVTPRLDAPAPMDAPVDAITTTCGDGVIDLGEECEGADLQGETCVSQGYASGELACGADCGFDKSGCVEATCGNGAIDAAEACDGAELGGATCATSGFVDGTLGCTSECELDTSGCRSCGDGDVDAGEECDGADLGGATCTGRGFTGGTLACDATCGIDDSACFDATCGDGVRAGSEDCDGSDLGGSECADVGLFAGTLGCNADCTFRIAECHNCGNGSIEGIEQCDGAALGGADCVSRGFTMGTLGCSATCAYDTSACATAACGNGMVESGEACDDGSPAGGDGCAACAVESGWSCTGAPSMCSPICGDGMLVGGQMCDGANLGGRTCTSLGFTGGTLSCSGTCTLVTTACTSTTCGNSVIDSGEECDDGNTTAFDGCDPGCQVDAGFHLPVRLRNGEGSNHGMVEVWYGGAWRDVCDDTYVVANQQAMADVVCRQLGFTGTGHQFINAFGGGSGSPVMDDVMCTGSEATLAQCPFRGWGLENCSATEAVGIRCMPGEGDIRLVGGPSGMEGRLQIWHSGAWGEVCDDYFDGAYSAYYGYSTTTVCQQLGYRGGSFVSTYDSPTSTFVLDDVNCTGTERRIGDCPHQPWGTENCSTIEGAGFRCDVHAEGDLRLRDGSGRHSGRVEILHQNVWGTVCDDFISTTGTRQTSFIAVGCGQLGFERAGSALVTTAVPDGIDPISMDDLNCAGTETALASCPFPGWRVHNCSHYEDIGLTCTP